MLLKSITRTPGWSAINVFVRVGERVVSTEPRRRWRMLSRKRQVSASGFTPSSRSSAATQVSYWRIARVEWPLSA
jgi:hypothetical protein